MDSLSELVRLLAPAGTVDLHCRVAGPWSAYNEQAAPGHVPYPRDPRRQSRSLGRKAEPTGRCGRCPAVSAWRRTHAVGHAGPQAQGHGVATLQWGGDGGDRAWRRRAARYPVWRGTFVLGSSSDVLLRTLPEVLCIATTGPAEGDLAWLRGLIGMMHAEADQPRPG